MIGWIRNYTRKIFAPDQASPPLLGPDRAPSIREAITQPFIRFYDPTTLNFDAVGYGARPLPVQPDGPGGPQNFNSDCARQPQAEWNRSYDGGCETTEFFRRIMRQTGLEHV